MKTIIFLLSLLICISTSWAQTAELSPFVTGFTDPVDIAHCNDNRLFVVERAGIIKIVQDGQVLSSPFLNISGIVHDTGSEQGLLGLTFHPQYALNGFFYVYYIAGTGNGVSRLSRFTVSANPNVANASSEVIMWSLTQTPGTNHKGGDLDFGADGFLYFAPEMEAEREIQIINLKI